MGEPQESSKSRSALRKNVQIQVLAWLPWESLCRYRCVCKGWNDLFSSTGFITEHWALKLPNKKPRLLMCSRRDPLRFMAYSFFTKTWKNISCSFLTEKYPYHFCTTSFDSSAAGLILMTVGHINHHKKLVTHHIVCNPLTRTSLELPAMNDTTILSMGIREGEGEGQREATYEVVALVQSGDAQRIEIYASSSKSWTTVGYLQHKLEVNRLESKTMLVFCGDVWYGLAKDVNYDAMGITDFTIQNWILTTMTLPALIVSERVDHLLSCGARILIATCTSLEYKEMGEFIIIWEFRKEDRTFHRIVTIDRLIFQGNDNGILAYEFEGINGDLICIKNRYSVEVFVYNLNEKTLSRLPIDDGIRGAPIPNIIGFQPRPDMKVE